MRRALPLALLHLVVLSAACARGGEYKTRSGERPTLFDRVAHDWSRAFGPRDAEDPGHVHAADLAVLPDGFLLVGGFEASSGLRLDEAHSLESGGGGDGFIARMGWDGRTSWARAFGGSGIERITAATADSSGRLALALSLFEESAPAIDSQRAMVRGRPGALILLLDAQGRVAHRVPVHTDRHLHIKGLAMASGGAGSRDGPLIIAAGMFHGTMRVADRVFTSEGGSDIMLLALDSRGELLWAQRDGGQGSDMALDLAARGDRVVIGGAFTDRARIGEKDIRAIPRPGRFRRPAQDAFVASLHAESGELVWLQTIGGPALESTLAVAMGPGDRAYAAGTFERDASIKLRPLAGPGQSDDMFILALDEGGGIAWSRTLGGPGRDHPLVMTALADGVAVAGTFEQSLPVDTYRLTSAGAHDIFAFATTRDGAIKWARRFGGPSHDAPSAILAADEALILAGTFTGRADLGGDAPLTAPGRGRGFLMRFR